MGSPPITEHRIPIIGLRSPIPQGLATSLAVAVALPLLLGLFAQPVVRWLRVVFYLGILIFPALMLCRMLWAWLQEEESIGRILLRYLRPVPPGAVYGSDLKFQGVPYATVGLIIINTLTFLVIPQSWIKLLVFLPVGSANGWHVLGTAVTSAFLHANTKHLLFNMFFLWGFGQGAGPNP